MISQPYGTSLDAQEGNFYGDDTIQKRLDKSFSNLDRALDTLRGRTADMLRLRRFSRWYDDNHFGKSRYMDELERGALNLEHDTQVFQEIADIRWRYGLMVASNPLSAKMQKLRSTSKICEHRMTESQLFSQFSPDPSRVYPNFTPRQWINYSRASLQPEIFRLQDREERARMEKDQDEGRRSARNGNEIEEREDFKDQLGFRRVVPILSRWDSGP